MANQFIREPIVGGDVDTWADYELAQNRLDIGQYSCKVYDDAGTLKLSVGKIGIDNNSVKGVCGIDTITTISVAGVSTSTWFKVEISISGTTVTIEASDISGETDPGSIPAGFTGAYDAEKAGYYITATKRCIAIGFLDSGDALNGIINTIANQEGYWGATYSDDVNKFTYNYYNIKGQDIVNGEYNRGAFFLIDVEDRPAAWILSGGTDTSFTDVDFSSYVPSGVKALLLIGLIRFTGDGALDSANLFIRANGSSETDTDRVRTLHVTRTDMTAGLKVGIGSLFICECDSDGIIEYYVSNAAHEAYLTLAGYYM